MLRFIKSAIAVGIGFSPGYGHAQMQANIWYFGDHAGLDFNGGAPVSAEGSAVYNVSSYSEGTAVIADAQGQLLFYTNGEVLWNREHQPMPNGEGLMGNFSATQSSIIVPLPGSDRYYYVFTVDDYFEHHLVNGFRYSVVDMCADDGLGDVSSPAEKNVLLLDTVEEKVAVVRHANGMDYWVLTHKLYADSFHAFLLTAAGLQPPIVSHVGAVHYGPQGQLKFSPDGTRVACASAMHWSPPYYFELFEFDPSTGVASNVRTLQRPNDGAIYGTEFSPDGSKLYGVFSTVSPLEMGLAQYDVLAGGGDEAAINQTMTVIFTSGSVTLKALQIGPDGRIYMPGVDWNLHVVLSPNGSGEDCGFSYAAVPLNNAVSKGLPSFVAGLDYSSTTVECGAGPIGYETQLAAGPDPNVIYDPWQRVLTIELPIRWGTGSVTVRDPSGRLLKRTVVGGQSAIRMSASDLASGIYLLSFTRTGDGVRSCERKVAVY